MNRFDFIEQTLKEAATLLLDKKDKSFSFIQKEGDARNLLTELDILLNNFLKEKIGAAFPHETIYSEEDESTSASKFGNFWTIDPIDGTSNFVKGIPHYGICITYFENSEPVVGGIVNPVIKEIFMVKKGGGAFLNGNLVKPGNIRDLGHATVAIGPGRKNEDRIWAAELYTNLITKIKSMKAFGSSGLDLCFLASGRLDIVVYASLSTLDVASSILFVEEAGGVVVDSDFNSVKFSDEPQKIYAFANRDIMEEFKFF